MYILERLIISIAWLICFISLWLTTKQKYRQASFILILSQLPAWIFGLIFVEVGLIEYPVRELHKANATSFSFEYLVLPTLCTYFNLYFPENKSYCKKIIYYITFLTPFTLIEYFTEKYTLIIRYIHWEWYTTFITMGVFIYFIRSVYKWFFKLDKPFSL